MLSDNKMLEALAMNEPELLTDTGGAQLAGESDTSLTVISKLSDLYDRELVGIIGWAKQIPGIELWKRLIANHVCFLM